MNNLDHTQQDMVRLLASCESVDELNMLAYTFNCAYKVLYDMAVEREHPKHE